jgi:hypothetical protein
MPVERKSKRPLRVKIIEPIDEPLAPASLIPKGKLVKPKAHSQTPSSEIKVKRRGSEVSTSSVANVSYVESSLDSDVAHRDCHSHKKSIGTKRNNADNESCPYSVKANTDTDSHTGQQASSGTHINESFYGNGRSSRR